MMSVLHMVPQERWVEKKCMASLSIVGVRPI